MVFGAHFALQLYLQLFVARLSSSADPMSLMPEYGVLTGANMVFFVGKTVVLFVVAINSAAHLHSYLVKTLISLTKRAVDTTSMGVFVTAATSEMDIIDNKLAVAIEVVVRMALSLLQVVVLGSVSTYGFFAVVVIAITTGVVLLARWFGRSSIEIARSVSSCKGPVVARILEEELAVLSIRSFHVESQWSEEITRRAWTLASVNLVSAACNRWLNLRLSLLGGERRTKIVVFFFSFAKQTKQRAGCLGVVVCCFDRSVFQQGAYSAWSCCLFGHEANFQYGDSILG